MATRRALAVAVAGALALAACTGPTEGPTTAPPTSEGDGGHLPSTSGAPYRDPELPVAERVEDLLARMDVVDKVGQMTQAERGQAGPGLVNALRIGSVLSGGGSAPEPNTPEGWADMYDEYQQGALATLLGIPIIYGVDAVHGHNTCPGLPSSRTTSASGPRATQSSSNESPARPLSRSPRPDPRGPSPHACASHVTTAGAAPTSRSRRTLRSCPRWRAP